MSDLRRNITPDNNVYAAGMCFNNNTIVDLLLVSLAPVFGINEHSSASNLLPKLVFVSTFFEKEIDIRFAKPSAEDLKIVIYTILGELVYETAVHSTPIQLELKDDRIARIPEGVYFLSVTQGGIVYPSEKIIKY
ncbi:MAG: T9SS type A sorting domain-containing protein [Thermoplasmata archaeon]|nr:T9SS type A sorting domain-containing protein [Thermoplasmata archaeon]